MKTLYTQSELMVPGAFDAMTNGGTTNPFVQINGTNGVSVRGYVVGFSEVNVIITETSDPFSNQHIYALSAVQSLQILTPGSTQSGTPPVPASFAGMSLTNQLLLVGGGVLLLLLLFWPRKSPTRIAYYPSS